MTEQDDREAARIAVHQALITTAAGMAVKLADYEQATYDAILDRAADNLYAAGFRRPEPQTKCLDCGRTDGGCDRVVQGDAKLPQNSEPQDDRIVIYANSNVSRGKFAAAAVHAALTAAGVHPGVAVIVLGAKPSEIENLTTVIHDAGRTEVEPGTVTAGTDWRPEPQGPETATLVVSPRHEGKNSAMVEAILERANERGIRVQIVEPQERRYEYAIMRHASMPDMSGRRQYTQITAATFPSSEDAENARRYVPALRGVPAFICKRIAPGPWEPIGVPDDQQ